MRRGNGTELDQLVNSMKAAASPLREVLQEVYDAIKDDHSGKNADYIPELSKADPASFGIVIVSVDGTVYQVGDSQKEFTIQSVSKPFMFGLALEQHGREATLKKVGVEPTGEAFNAIVLDERTNRPYNPMVNAGAIATADLVEGKDFPDRFNQTQAMFQRYCGRELRVDNSVFLSERATGHRNRAIAHLMLNFDMVSPRVDESLELYFQQCSFLINACDLAMMGATLANGGVNPVTGERAIQAQYVKDLLSIMLSCGMYDYAGEWAYRVGIPAKSGVGGGIVGVIPGVAGIGTFSTPLDAKGNSVRGIRVFKALSEKFSLHALDNDPSKPSLQSLMTRRAA